VRYTKIGTASYAIAAGLVVAVVTVAWARSRPAAEPAAATPAERAPAVPGTLAAQESDAAAYRADCASCHREGEARGRSIPPLRGYVVELFTSEGGRDYLVDFMLTGRVRIIEEGRVMYDETHPSYGQLSDERIAGILNYMLTSWGNDALLPDDRRLYTGADIAAGR
jgi:mono/diheme cytochrome c family protein